MEKYWNLERQHLLAQTYYMLPKLELRMLFHGRSNCNITAQAYVLKALGWTFIHVSN
jgi:hypothetical protein